MRARMYRDDLERVVDEIENSEVMWLGISKGIHGYNQINIDDEVTVRSEVARLTRLYDRAVRTNTMNNPDMYMAGAFDGAQTGLRKGPIVPQPTVPIPIPAAAPVAPMPGAAAAAAPAPAPPPAAPVAADPDESPAPAVKPKPPAAPVAPAESSEDAPKDVTKGDTKESTKHGPMDSAKEAPKDDTKDAPKDATKDAPKDDTKDTPKDETTGPPGPSPPDDEPATESTEAPSTSATTASNQKVSPDAQDLHHDTDKDTTAKQRWEQRAAESPWLSGENGASVFHKASGPPESFSPDNPGPMRKSKWER